MDFNKIGVEFSNNDDDVRVYSFDATNIEGRPLGVFWPKSTEEVSKVLASCYRNDIPVTIRGAGTSLAGGATPADSVVLDMSRMNRILEVGDGFAVVEAGVIINELNMELEKHNLIFPVKPASASVCQVGGAIATNAAGERAIKYGKMENWVDSVEIVFPTGRVEWAKPDDFVGAEGLTGVITKAKLRLTKPPEKYSVDHKVFRDIGSMLSYISGLKNLLSVEFINPLAAGLMNLEKGNHIIAEFESDDGELKGEAAQKMIRMREGAGPALTSEGFVVMEDPYIPGKEMGKFVDWLEKNEIPAFGHIAFGIIHPRFQQGSDRIEKMFAVVKRLGGDVSGEHGIGMTKKKFLSPYAIRKIREVKARYDRKKILNRGKVV